MRVNVIVHWEALVMLALLSGLQLQGNLYPEVTFSLVLIAKPFLVLLCILEAILMYCVSFKSLFCS